MTKQRLLANTLEYAGLLSFLLRRRPKDITILAYHRILDNNVSADTLPDKGLFSASAQMFEQQMQLVARHFHSTTFRQLNRPGVPPQRNIIISFDDGYEDNYRLAYPILRKYGLKAVFFVTSDFIDNQQPLWFDLTASLLAAPALPETLTLAGITFTPNTVDRQILLHQVLSALKTLPDDSRQQWIIQLQQQLSGQIMPQAGKPMTWDQLREMHASGMEIGSHSRTHTVLANESNERIISELSWSKARLETELNADCISLAYPVGGHHAIDERVINIAKQCAYQYGCTYTHDINHLPISQPLTLHRQHVELDLPLTQFKAQLAWPSLFGYSRP